jgi:carbon monoxide dehydrogenase subunit G
MASIHKEIHVAALPDRIWDALKDVGAIHTRLAKGFVLDTQLEGDTRKVTFANGVVALERIIEVDDHRRRLVWSVVQGRPTHHNASIQVFADGEGSRLVWIADLLPNELAPAIETMIDHGMRAMKHTLENAT